MNYVGKHRWGVPRDPFTGPLFPNWMLDKYWRV